MQIIKTFSNGKVLTYDKGQFDNWCIYLVENRNRIAPKDVEYFTDLQALGNRFGAKRVYDDFLSVYHRTTRELDSNILQLITLLSKSYKNHSGKFDYLFTLVYAGMVAEENKENAVLKKRIKHLGLYQVLIEDLSPHKAANFSRGMKWQDIDTLCKERGF